VTVGADGAMTSAPREGDDAAGQLASPQRHGALGQHDDQQRPQIIQQVRLGDRREPERGHEARVVQEQAGDPETQDGGRHPPFAPPVDGSEAAAAQRDARQQQRRGVARQAHEGREQRP
jgi:hypothetical protein